MLAASLMHGRSMDVNSLKRQLQSCQNAQQRTAVCETLNDKLTRQLMTPADAAWSTSFASSARSLFTGTHSKLLKAISKGLIST